MPDIGEYLEKKKEMAKKEQKFMSEIEIASQLIEDHEFDKGIEKFKELIPLAEDMKWGDKVSMLQDMIYDAREKEKQYITEQERKKSQLESKKKQEILYNDALDLMGEASEAYKSKQLNKALGLYKEALSLLKQINATREIQIVSESIDKISHEIKSRDLHETQRRQTEKVKAKERVREEQELLARKERDEKKRLKELEKMKELERRKQNEETLVDAAMEALDKANLKLKDAKANNFLGVEPKKNRYNDAIELYEEAASLFKKANWLDEADKVLDTVLQVKRERDDDIERFSKKISKKKEIKTSLQGMPIITSAPPRDETLTEEQKKELKEEKQNREEAFAALDEASHALEAFQKKPKVIGGQIFKDNEYPEIKRMYMKALGLFKEIGWMNEAAKIEESIEILNKKEEDFLVEKESFDRHVLSKSDGEEREREERKKATLKQLERNKKVREKVNARKAANKVTREKIDAFLEEGMKHFKNNDLVMSEKEYMHAYDLMMEAGWENEASSVMDTIDMIREKLERRDDSLLKKERSVDESGSFTMGVEQITETMDMMKQQEVQAKEAQMKEKMEKKALEKVKQEKMFDHLAAAQEFMKSREYTNALRSYHKALKLAEELSWTSQVRDISDFMVEARKQKEKQEQLKKSKARKEKVENGDGASAAEPSVDLEAKQQARIADQESIRAEKQEKQEMMFNLLSNARDAMQSKDFDQAIEKFQDALLVALDLNWTSQIRDIKDFISSAKQKRTVEQQRMDRVKTLEADSDLVSRQVRQEAETSSDVDASARIATTKGKEKAIADQAYELLDEANKLLKEGEREDAIEKFQTAMKKFDLIKWKRERDAVLQQIRKVEAMIEEDNAVAEKQAEKQKTQDAYDAINRAEKCIRNKKQEEAIVCYEEALEVFQEVGWTNEAKMVQDQIQKVKDDMNKKLVADTVQTEKAMVERAYALIDKARQSQRNRKIFKAVEHAHAALEIFKSLGEDWSREIKQVKKFVDDLDREKKRKEELIKKLKLGEL
ncbi:hypothetical protein GF325_00165 [Candidatus Bathyarchaeota archaeon]|nr:hypothetical protein [Candidatus Bathyarchaeota archaeon]